MTDDYLWDKSGAVDLEIEKLERTLSTLSLDVRDRSLDPGPAPMPAPRSPVPLAWLAAAAALAVGVGTGYFMGERQDTPIALAPDARPAPPSAPGMGAREPCPPCPSVAVPPAPAPSPKKPKKSEILDPFAPRTTPHSAPRAPTSGGEVLDPWAMNKLSASEVQRVVAARSPEVRQRCWQPALAKREPGAPETARVTVTLAIAPDGSVRSASSGASPSGYPGLASCIVGQARRWQFPKSRGSTTVNVPFVFSAQR